MAGLCRAAGDAGIGSNLLESSWSSTSDQVDSREAENIICGDVWDGPVADDAVTRYSAGPLGQTLPRRLLAGFEQKFGEQVNCAPDLAGRGDRVERRR